MDNWISIIVPIFDVEKYLPKCVDSILMQDIPYGALELILVDDGSPDGCPEIADEYANKYNFIKILHKINGGLGDARNYGLEAANGKYVMFLDSDDFLEPNVMDQLKSIIEKDDLDVLRFNYRYINEKSGTSINGSELDEYVRFNTSVMRGERFLYECLGYGCYAWQFIIRRELLTQNDLLFKKGVYFEDTEWTPRMLSIAQRVRSIGTVVYNYIQRSGSITNSTSLKKIEKNLRDKMLLICSLIDQMKECADKRWYLGMISSTSISALDIISIHFYPTRDKYLQDLNNLKIFPLSSFHIGRRAKKKIWLINFSPSLYCDLIHFKNT